MISKDTKQISAHGKKTKNKQKINKKETKNKQKINKK